ncbi:hypothetical protein [Lacunimicrobium album]
MIPELHVKVIDENTVCVVPMESSFLEDFQDVFSQAGLSSRIDAVRLMQTQQGITPAAYCLEVKGTWKQVFASLAESSKWN